MPTPSSIVSFTTPTASNSPAKACAGPEANKTRRLDQTSSPVTQIHRPARLATRAASFRYGGRHHSGIPGAIIPLYPGDFVGTLNMVNDDDDPRAPYKVYEGEELKGTYATRAEARRAQQRLAESEPDRPLHHYGRSGPHCYVPQHLKGA